MLSQKWGMRRWINDSINNTYPFLIYLLGMKIRRDVAKISGKEIPSKPLRLPKNWTDLHGRIKTTYVRNDRMLPLHTPQCAGRTLFMASIKSPKGTLYMTHCRALCVKPIYTMEYSSLEQATTQWTQDAIITSLLRRYYYVIFPWDIYIYCNSFRRAPYSIFTTLSQEICEYHALGPLLLT